MSRKKIYVLGGGTVSYVRPHLALTAPAFGETARRIDDLCRSRTDHNADVVLHLTKMASCGQGFLETNADVQALFNTLVDDPDTAVIFMNVAMVDYDGVIEDGGTGGKYGSRLKTREQPNPVIQTQRVPKFLPDVRTKRPDICLVAFKTVCNTTVEDMKTRGMFLLTGAKCDFVLVNDTGTRLNLIVGAPGVCWPPSTDRQAAVEALVKLTLEHSFPPDSVVPAVSEVESKVRAHAEATVFRSLAVAAMEPAVPQSLIGAAVEHAGPQSLIGAAVEHAGPQSPVVAAVAPMVGASDAPTPTAVVPAVLKKCTLVTGGGRGIGRACALRMSSAGPVFLVGTTEVYLQAVCREICEMGGEAEYFVGDVADRAVSIAAVAKVAELGWQVRHLVCNAGIGGKGAMVGFDPQKWMRVFDVNVHGSFHFIQACLPSLLEQKGGSISLISSTLGVKGYKYDTAYAATKHAQVGMARSLAMEVAKHGVVVVPICPSFVDTDMVTRMIANLMKHKNMTQPEAENYLAERNPQKRIIPAEEVAEAVALVCSGKLRCLNGEPLVLDGGAE